MNAQSRQQAERYPLSQQRERYPSTQEPEPYLSTQGECLAPIDWSKSQPGMIPWRQPVDHFIPIPPNVGNQTAPAPVILSGALRQADAESYLGMGAGWLDDAPHIPRCDIRKPGTMRAVWVWRREDLDTFLYARRVLPGQSTPWGSADRY